MKKRKKTDPEWLKFRAESDEHIRQVRERVTRELAEIEARKAAEAGSTPPA